VGPIALIVDSGPLYALIDESDRDHEACLALLESYAGPLLVPQLVIAEVAYLIETRLGSRAEVQFVGDLAAGTFTTEPVIAADWIRIAELVGKYHDLTLGTVDASVVATAERLWASTIATLDRRHFSVVRPKHVRAFEIVP
jgi:predicted nucleic acid-binding protein